MMRASCILRHILFALSFSSELYFPRGRKRHVREAWTWTESAFSGERIPCADPRRVTVILLSYRRPWNMAGLVSACLRCERIGRVIVSGNDPATDIRRFLRMSDERLTIIRRTRRMLPGIMPLIAVDRTRRGDSLFLAIDDDLLLTSRQIDALCDRLLEDPSVPHGVVGQTMHPNGTAREAHVTGEREVDVLNRAYAFTARHAYRYEETARRLGRDSREAMEELPFGSDVILSACGSSRPRIHDLGELFSCPTAAYPGIARFKDEGFDAFRAALFRDVSAIACPVPRGA